MGGRSGQTLAGGNGDVLDSDYENAAIKDWYQVYGNGSASDKTLTAYAERGFYVNYNIRDGNLDEQDKQYISNLDKALNRLPIEKQQTLYRGVNLDNNTYNDIKEGGEIKFNAYTSTTKDIGNVDKFKGKSPNANSTPVTFIIVSHKSGKSIEQYSNIKSEKEVVFGRNTKWKVIKKDNSVITIKQI